MTVSIIDMVGDENPIVTVRVDTIHNGTLNFSARVFMSKELVKEIDDMDGWKDYHKEWCQGISKYLEDFNASTDIEIAQCITTYLNNY
jgi:hypothetical protein